MFKKTVLLVFAVIALVYVNVNADIIAGASFEDNNLGAIAGQAGGTGWQGTWDATSSSGTASDFTTVVNKNLVYSGTDFTVNGGSNAIQLSGTGNNAAASRQLASPFTGGSGSDEVLYYRFIMNYNHNEGTEGDDRCLVSFTKDHDKNGNVWWNRLRAGSRLMAGPDWQLKTDTGTKNFGGDLAPSDDVHMVVVKIFKSGVMSTFDSYTMFLDPQSKLAEGGLAFDTLSPSYAFDEFNWLGIMQRTIDTGDIYYVDDVVVATTWQEAVTGVPEPTALILLSMGGLALRRKAKKA
jgi:hypothetical protein